MDGNGYCCHDLRLRIKIKKLKPHNTHIFPLQIRYKCCISQQLFVFCNLVITVALCCILYSCVITLIQENNTNRLAQNIIFLLTQVSFGMLLKQMVRREGLICKTRRCHQKAKHRAINKKIFVRIE